MKRIVFLLNIIVLLICGQSVFGQSATYMVQVQYKDASTGNLTPALPSGIAVTDIDWTITLIRGGSEICSKDQTDQPAQWPLNGAAFQLNLSIFSACSAGGITGWRDDDIAVLTMKINKVGNLYHGATSISSLKLTTGGVNSALGEAAIIFEVVKTTPITVEILPVADVCEVKNSSPVYVDLEAVLTSGHSNVNYLWSNVGNTLSIFDNTTSIAKVNITGIAAGVYTFQVLVEDGDNTSNVATRTVTVTIKSGPQVSLNVTNSCYPPKLTATVNGGIIPYSWGAIGAPVGANFVTGDENADNIRNIEWNANSGGSVGNFKAYIVVKNTDGCKDSVAVEVAYVNMKLSASWKFPQDTCIQLPGELPLSCSTSFPDNYILNYEFSAVGASAIKKSMDIALPPTSGKGIMLPIQQAGTYKLVDIVSKKHPECPSLINFGNASIKVAESPDVALNSSCLALYKDSSFMLNVVNVKNYDYLWRVNVYDMLLHDWKSGGTGDKTVGTQINGVMADGNLRYVITATDKSTLKCKASDTAIIYRIPDSPTVDIDTNTNRFNIRLAWSSVIGADVYSVWSRKWDPYCLTTAYTGDQVYLLEGTTKDLFWVEPSMDTMEFYYVTADLSKCGQVFHSINNSDTVGYKLDNLLVNPKLGRKSNNMVSLMFDMSSKGISTSADLLKFVGEDVSALLSWDMINQDWLIQDYLNPMYPIMGNEYVNEYALTVGEVYEFDVARPLRFMQYGKLPNRIEQLLNIVTKPNNAKGPNNNSTIAYQHTHYSTAADLMRSLNNIVSVVRKWDFVNQDWLIQTYKNGLYPIMGDEFISGDERLWPGIPLQIQSEMSSYIWK